MRKDITKKNKFHIKNQLIKDHFVINKMSKKLRSRKLFSAYLIQSKVSKYVKGLRKRLKEKKEKISNQEKNNALDHVKSMSAINVNNDLEEDELMRNTKGFILISKKFVKKGEEISIVIQKLVNRKHKRYYFEFEDSILRWKEKKESSKFAGRLFLEAVKDMQMGLNNSLNFVRIFILFSIFTS